MAVSSNRLKLRLLLSGVVIIYACLHLFVFNRHFNMLPWHDFVHAFSNPNAWIAFGPILALLLFAVLLVVFRFVRGGMSLPILILNIAIFVTIGIGYVYYSLSVHQTHQVISAAQTSISHK